MKIYETKSYKESGYAPMMMRQRNGPNAPSNYDWRKNMPPSVPGNVGFGLQQVRALMKTDPEAAWKLLQNDVRYRMTSPQEAQECDQLAEQIRPLLNQKKQNWFQRAIGWH